jgi:THAP domain
MKYLVKKYAHIHKCKYIPSAWFIESNVFVLFVVCVIYIMPLTCCVPGCRGNYRGTKEQPFEKVSVFKIPEDPDMRTKWTRMIPRENLCVNDRTVVCEKHFAPHFIIRVDTATRADGSILSVPRKIPKLAVDAYPSVFPNLPSYLSKEPAAKRKTPDSRRTEMDARDEQRFDDWLLKDKIVSFDELSTNLDQYIKDNYSDWIIAHTAEFICIYRIVLIDSPRITVAVRINTSLHVDVFRGELQLASTSLAWILGAECTVTCWSQLSTLLSHFSSVVDNDDE